MDNDIFSEILPLNYVSVKAQAELLHGNIYVHILLDFAHTKTNLIRLLRRCTRLFSNVLFILHNILAPVEPWPFSRLMNTHYSMFRKYCGERFSC